MRFRIEQCQDDVYTSDSEDEADTDGASGAPVVFPQTFIFSCVGLGLTNFARKLE